MKPYFLVLHNCLRLSCMKLKARQTTAGTVQLLSRNTKLVFHKTSRVTLGSKIVSDGRCVIIVDKDAELTIGDGVYFNEDAMISCKERVTIGRGCKFGPNVKVFDNNHRFDPENGVSDAHSKGTVSIGEGCWIGSNCVILKGADIGRNCVIGAGCIVSGSIPAGSIVTQGRDLTITPMEKRGGSHE